MSCRSRILLSKVVLWIWALRKTNLRFNTTIEVLYGVLEHQLCNFSGEILPETILFGKLCSKLVTFVQPAPKEILSWSSGLRLTISPVNVRIFRSTKSKGSVRPKYSKILLTEYNIPDDYASWIFYSA